MPVREPLLCLHLLAAALWVGGMATMVFAVRPALPAIDAVPQRLRFMVALLGRLFAWVALAIVVLFATGWGLAQDLGGWHAAPWRVHAMFAITLLMTLVFAVVRYGPYPRLKRAVAGGELSVAAARLVLVRRLIALNLVLGVAVFAVATLGRAVS
jgi:uncharacterized membrane protein